MRAVAPGEPGAPPPIPGDIYDFTGVDPLPGVDALGNPAVGDYPPFNPLSGDPQTVLNFVFFDANSLPWDSRQYPEGVPVKTMAQMTGYIQAAVKAATAQYGEGNVAIGQINFTGHGTPGKIGIGAGDDPNSSHFLTGGNIAGILGGLGDLALPDGQSSMVFNSCHTGKDMSFLQDTANVTGFTAYAADIQTLSSPNDLHVNAYVLYNCGAWKSASPAP